MKSFSAFITEKKKPEKPDGVNQANVSKDAANYRRAQRQRNATGGPTTGRTGKKSFPGDRSGAYAKAKSDLEARKGFSGSKSGGLKADEANPNVDRSVRQKRTVKQGIPDPFETKTKTPSNPFKGLRTGSKPQTPDPFTGNSSVPEPRLQGPARAKPLTYSTAGPATRQAMGDIAKSSERLRKAGVVLRTPGDNEKLVSDPPKPRKTPSVSSADKTTGAEFYKKPTTPPKSPGDANTRPPIRAGHGVARSRADAIRSGMKGASVGQDKRAGADLLDRLTGQKSGFQKMSQRADEISARTKAQAKELTKNVSGPSKPPKPPATPKGVTGGLTAPKGFKPSPGVGPKTYTPDEKALQSRQRKMAQSGVDPSGRKLSKAERIRAHKVSQNPRAVEVAKPKPKSSATSVGPRLSKGSTSSALTLPGQKALPAKKIKLPSPKPELASKVKDALPGFKETRSGAQTLKPAGKLSKLKGFARGAGRVAGPALAVVGAGLDYADDRAKGYNRTSSALRTGAKALGGAAGAALGSIAGPLGTAAGYAAGHWLTTKVLDKFHKPSKPKTPKQPTGKQKLGAAASSAVGAPIRALTGTPAPKPAPKKEPMKDPLKYLKVNR